MRILFDIVHPADVLFFLHPIRMMESQGHEVLIASRDKDITLKSIDAYGLPHVVISTCSAGGLALARELVMRDWRLYRLARRFKPHIMAGFGGVTVSHVGRLLGIPAIAFYDNDTAWLQNALSYRFLTHLYVPVSYSGRLPARHTRVESFKELSYLHPSRFQPNRERAIQNGIDPLRDNFFLRVVAWRSNHDLGRKGWTPELLPRIVEWLSARGKVHLSSEISLPESLRPLLYCGDKVALHDVLAHCRLFVGESSTMAAEAAVLGCPAVFAAPAPGCFVRELADRYGLIACTPPMFDAVRSAMEALLAEPPEHFQARRARMLEEKADMVPIVINALFQHGAT